MTVKEIIADEVVVLLDGKPIKGVKMSKYSIGDYVTVDGKHPGKIFGIAEYSGFGQEYAVTLLDETIPNRNVIAKEDWLSSPKVELGDKVKTEFGEGIVVSLLEDYQPEKDPCLVRRENLNEEEDLSFSLSIYNYEHHVLPKSEVVVLSKGDQSE